MQNLHRDNEDSSWGGKILLIEQVTKSIMQYALKLLVKYLCWMGKRVTHKVVTTAADSEVVQFFEGYATLAFANVARNSVVYGAISDQQSAFLTLAFSIDFDSND